MHVHYNPRPKMYRVLRSCVIFMVVSCSQALPTQTRRLSEEFQFTHSKQAEFIQSLTDYELVIPALVDSNGAFLTHDLNYHKSWYRHNRPHINTDPSLHNDEENPSPWLRDATGDDGNLLPVMVHYTLDLGDRGEVRLELTRNHRLISPGFVVERRRGANVSNAQLKAAGGSADNHCHFNGRVHGHEGSRVAVSTCQGVVGLIQFQEDEFFIEPVKDYVINQTTRHHPHVVYKRSALPQQTRQAPRRKRESDPLPLTDDVQQDFCGVQSTEAQIQLDLPGGKTGDDLATSSRHRRRHRSVSEERNVELLVVVDKHMMHYYVDDDIETYVLTIINMVASIYHDVSLGNYVNIVMVRLLFLEEDEKGLSIEHDADKTLSSFCRWQDTINPRDDSHPNHHDVAVLLTRKDLCKGFDAPCGTLGLAQVSGMCQDEWSCNINEDTGLALAYTVAHELGHSFGMQHDSLHEACSKSTHVMSSQLTGLNGALTWSKCSSQYITRFLDRGAGQCLVDEPRRHEFHYPLVPPGIMYTAEHQCRLQYGANASVCSQLEPNQCSTLWCKSGSHCHSKLSAAAPGTSCGRDKWCDGGECVDIKESPKPIHGDWGPWTDWSACSLSCGGGVAIKQRHCDNPRPSNGGRYCVGERKKYAICNRQDCPNGSPSSRAAQCNYYNGQAYNDIYFHWVPYYKERALCELHCKPVEKNFMLPVKFSSAVIDGTPCTEDTDDMCIDGICYTVGCDYKINSNAVEDRCGVCHGDGSSCQTITDQLIKQEGFGYVEAMVIPAGARNIHVEEVAESNNFLALMDSSGHYYLNGGWDIKWSGRYEAAGTVVNYERDDENKETFNAKGPLKQPLHVMLLFQSKTAGVAYEYTVPKPGNLTAFIPKHFEWEIVGWSPCTATCGSGLQRLIIQCTERIAGRVEDTYCNSSGLIQQQRQCNVHQCPANWWIGPWQHCSVTCGSGGMRSRSVFCIRSIGQDEQVALVDEDCLRLGLSKPLITEGCSVETTCPKEAYWLTGEWSQCLYTNGRVEQTRTVQCSRTDTFCDYTSRPLTRQVCRDSSDHLYDYYGESSLVGMDPISFGEWERMEGQLAHMQNNLQATRKPQPIRKQWPVTPTNQIPVKTPHDYGNGGALVGGAFYDAILGVELPRVDPDIDWVESLKHGRGTNGISLTKNIVPLSSMEENMTTEGSVSVRQTLWWFAGPWTECSSSCGDGTRHRSIECLEVSTGLLHIGCDQTIRPAEHEQCHLTDCTGNSAFSTKPTCEGDKHSTSWCHLVLTMGNCRKDMYRDMCCTTCTSKLTGNKATPHYT